VLRVTVCARRFRCVLVNCCQRIFAERLEAAVGTSVVNGTLDRDHAVAERWARRPFRRAA
jgi:hypothetical protein